MHTSNLHLDILDKPRLDLFDQLAPYTKNFYLSGGTALALQLGHRKSFDFDFFSANPIAPKLLEKISKEIAVQTVSIDTPDELTFFTKEDIKLTFLQYPFPVSYDLFDLDNGIKLAPVKEIAVQKAYTVGRRGEYRDYFDLYTIFRRNLISLKSIITKAEEKYGNIFNNKLFLEQLVYFDDLLNFEIISAKEQKVPDQKEIHLFLEHTVRRYLSGID